MFLHRRALELRRDLLEVVEAPHRVGCDDRHRGQDDERRGEGSGGGPARGRRRGHDGHEQPVRDSGGEAEEPDQQGCASPLAFGHG